MSEYMNPKDLKPDPNQPRTIFDDDSIEALAESYDKLGMVDPIEIDENNIIIRGERRWRAARLADLEKVPIFLLPIMGSNKRLERQLLEQEDYTPIDRMWAYATAIYNINSGEEKTIPQIKKMNREKLINIVFGSTGGRGGGGKGMEELKRRIGISYKIICSCLQMLKLNNKTIKAVEEGKIPITTGLILNPIKDQQTKTTIEEVTREDELKQKDIQKLSKVFREEKDIDTKIVREVVEMEEDKAIEHINKAKGLPTPIELDENADITKADKMISHINAIGNWNKTTFADLRVDQARRVYNEIIEVQGLINDLVNSLGDTLKSRQLYEGV